MFNIPIRKLLSAVFFIIIIILLFVLFKQIGFNKPDRLIILIFGGIFFSGLFMFILQFTNIVQKSKPKERIKETETIESEEIDQKKNEKQINLYSEGIITNINKSNDLKSLGDLLLKNFAKQFSIVQGIIFVKTKSTEIFKSISAYAYFSDEKSFEFIEGDGITGQVAKNKQVELISDIAEGYITVISGLGSSSPRHLLIIPFVHNNETIAIAELAAFEEFPPCYQDVYKIINNPVSETFNALL